MFFHYCTYLNPSSHIIRILQISQIIFGNNCLSFFRRVIADPGPKRGSATSKRKAELTFADEEEESDEENFKTPKGKKFVDGPVDGPASGGSAELRVNRHGLACLKNGVVSLKALKLSEDINKKKRWPDALELLGAKLVFGQAYTLFALVVSGRDLPTEKVRDNAERTCIMNSAAPYALSEEQISALREADPYELLAYNLGMGKAAQQSLKYVMYGKVFQFYNDYVFTKNGVWPATDIRIHLGLVGDHEHKSFMDM